jgi:mono/diheme cytochrome c family protein
MVRIPIRFFAAALPLFATCAAVPAAADDAQIQRGKYLVIVSGCSDCHTPGALIGKPDASRYLAGSNVGFAIPGAGIFVGQNLTPDKETGIGDWSVEQIVTGIRTGKRPDGSMMSGVMPYPALSHLTDEDAQAIAAFLKSIPAVRNAIVSPLKPGQKIDFVSDVLPLDAYNALPASEK